MPFSLGAGEEVEKWRHSHKEPAKERALMPSSPSARPLALLPSDALSQRAAQLPALVQHGSRAERADHARDPVGPEPPPLGRPHLGQRGRLPLRASLAGRALRALPAKLRAGVSKERERVKKEGAILLDCCIS